MVPTSARAIARPASMQGGFSRGRNRGTCRWFRRANLSLSSTSRPLRRLASRSRPISPPKRMRLSNNPPRNVCFWHKADMGGDFSSTGLSRYDARLSLRERHMRRREFITLVGAAAAWPLSVRAQQPAHKLARIGLLQPSLDNPIVARGYPAFLEEMKKSGFSEGQNLTIVGDIVIFDVLGAAPRGSGATEAAAREDVRRVAESLRALHEDFNGEAFLIVPG